MSVRKPNWWTRDRIFKSALREKLDWNMAKTALLLLHEPTCTSLILFGQQIQIALEKMEAKKPLSYFHQRLWQEIEEDKPILRMFENDVGGES